MRQGLKARCIYGLITGLLLLLLQQSGFAQVETDTTVPVEDYEQRIDSAEVTVTNYDEVHQQEAEVIPEPIVFRQVPDSVISSLQKRKEFAYANDPAYWQREEDEEGDEGQSWLDWLTSRKWFRYMVLTVMALVLLFVIVKIAISNKLFITRGSRKSGIAEEDELLNKNNLPSLIQEAEAQSNFRSAVRYRYMKVLQDMDERKIIHLHAQSTNWDYVNSLGGHPLKKQFLLLTRAYEYVWYGEFEITGEQYGYLKTEYQQFENSLNQ